MVYTLWAADGRSGERELSEANQSGILVCNYDVSLLSSLLVQVPWILLIVDEHKWIYA